jgi:hypothetical protein
MSKKLDIGVKDAAVNLANIQNEMKDKSIVEILGTASYIAIYRFDRNLEENGSWVRLGVEGAAFVVRSTEIPYFRFVVLNRLGYKPIYIYI